MGRRIGQAGVVTFRIFMEFVPPVTPESSPWVVMIRSPAAARPRLVSTLKISGYRISGWVWVTSKSIG